MIKEEISKKVENNNKIFEKKEEDLGTPSKFIDEKMIQLSYLKDQLVFFG